MLKENKLTKALFVAIFAIASLAGCGGIEQEKVVDDDTNYNFDYKNIIPVKVLKVNNLTGKKKYDVLCNYLHIKIAQTLSDSGKYNVISDDLLGSFAEDFGNGKQQKPKQYFEVDIQSVKEADGGSFNFILFSSQKKIVKVKLKIKQLDENKKYISSKEETGISRSGVWGVIAKVNRKAILKKKGVFELDNSSLGMACIKALKKIIKTF